MPRITNGATTGTGPDVATDVVESLRRRPQTVGQLAQALARPEDALRAEVETLARAGRIRPVTDGLTHSASGEVFWTARHAETGE
jgi:predicted transcriptional regulator